jgi:hypothetical protein
MKISEEFPSRYLRAEDLKGKQVRLTIAGVEHDESIGKPAVSFKQTKKQLALNKTNATEIAYEYGDDTEAWLGKDILLTSARVNFQGKMTNAIRVAVPAAPTRAKVELPPDEDQEIRELEEIGEDKIPF